MTTWVTCQCRWECRCWWQWTWIVTGNLQNRKQDMTRLNSQRLETAWNNTSQHNRLSTRSSPPARFSDLRQVGGFEDAAAGDARSAEVQPSPRWALQRATRCDMMRHDATKRDRCENYRIGLHNDWILWNMRNMQSGNQVLLIQRHGFILNRVSRVLLHCTISRIWQPDFDAPSEQNNRPQRYASQQRMSSRNQSGALKHAFHASTYYQDIYICIYI